MPDVREKLVELLQSKYDHYCDQCGVNKDSHYTENLADYLIANGVTIQRWIPVTERLPNLELALARTEDMDLFPCLAVKSVPQSPKKRLVTKAWYDGKGFMDTDCIWVTKSVTHWMPLPEQPKEVE